MRRSQSQRFTISLGNPVKTAVDMNEQVSRDGNWVNRSWSFQVSRSISLCNSPHGCQWHRLVVVNMLVQCYLSCRMEKTLSLSPSQKFIADSSLEMSGQGLGLIFGFNGFGWYEKPSMGPVCCNAALLRTTDLSKIENRLTKFCYVYFTNCTVDLSCWFCNAILPKTPR